MKRKLQRVRWGSEEGGPLGARAPLLLKPSGVGPRGGGAMLTLQGAYFPLKPVANT